MSPTLFLKVQSFLESYINYHTKYFDNKHTIIVLPSKRAVAFLKRNFVKLSTTSWLPEIVDVITLVENISGYSIQNQYDTLLAFYKAYVKIATENNTDSFEQFCSWAPSLLSDFNELDRYLIDTDSFFKYHKELKELSYFGQTKTELIKSYIKFWEDLPKLYNTLKNNLEKEKKTYQGLAYRTAALKINSYLKQNTKTHIFLGFNALNKAEETIITSFLAENRANVFWDLDSYYLNENQHPSKKFIPHYIDMWQDYKSNLIRFNDKNFEKPKNLHYISSTKQVGICKSLSNILKQLPQNQLNETAVVLNDEELLIPLLNSIPDHIDKVNITMGMPLTNSPISDMFNLLVAHQKLQKNEIHVDTLLKLVSNLLIGSTHNLQLQIKDKNLLFFSSQELYNLKTEHYLQDLLLKCLTIFLKPLNFLDGLQEFFTALQATVSQHIAPFVKGYLNLIDKLLSVLEIHPDLTIKDACYLLNSYEKEEKLNFKGIQSEGLQIMGMLETRLLDYKNVIMLSVNEGIIPSGKTDNSFITYTQKKQYNLPTHKDKDAIYAYHFFRLIQRCENCYFLFDIDQTGMNKGELSRFAKYLQIFRLKQHSHNVSSFSVSTFINKRNKLEIQKTPEILEQLKKLSESGFSPTALITYIDNPITFYSKYILRVKENQQIEDEVNHRDYGTIVHQTLEDLYGNYSILTTENIAKMLKHKEERLQYHFNTIYSRESYKYGRNRLKFEIASSSISQLLKKEKENLAKNSITVIDLEKNIQIPFETSLNEVILKGTIDRIDRLHTNTIRIIDYKTGKVEPKELTIKDWEALITDYDYSKAFQTLFYAYIYSKTHQINELQAGIISLKNLKYWFMPVKLNKEKLITKPMLVEFESHLTHLIEEILNPDIPFLEKESKFDL